MASSDLYLTTESEITSIANAIRSKGGTLDFLVYPTGFVTAIEEIQTGGTLQSKSVTPSESSVTVVPDIGYDGLSQVSVDAISSNYIGSSVARKSAADVTVSGPTITVPAGYYSAQATKAVSSVVQATPTIIVSTAGLITATATQTAGYVAAGSKSATKQLTAKAAATYTPSTTNQTIASGQYLTGVQTIAGDSNLIAGNIKLGTSIFSVSGTYEDFPVTNAVLHINAPIGSTIDLVKGSIAIRLNASKGHTNIDGKTMDWYYSVSSSNYGDWSISAFNSNADSTYAYVTIDSAKQYDVSLNYNLYLIKNGEAQTGFEISYNSMTTHTLADGILYLADADGARIAVGPLPSANYYTKAVFEFEKIETIGSASNAGVGENPASSYKLTVKTALANSAVPVTVIVDISEITVYNLYAKIILGEGNVYNIRKVWLKNIYLAR